NTPLTSNADLVGDASLNIVPTVTLLEAIRDEGRRPHLIYVSTGGALYRVTEGVPSSEDSDVEPATSYGIQKLMGEHYLRFGAQETWLRPAVLAIATPYGFLLPSERGQGLIASALPKMLEGSPVRSSEIPRMSATTSISTTSFGCST